MARAGFQTVALGVDAFVAGWEIGSALNAAFLHINGVGLGNTATEGTGGTYIASPRWIYRQEGWDAFFGGAPAPAGWRLSGTLFSGGQSNGTFSLLQTVYPCSNGGDTAWTGVCNYDTAVANAFSRLNASSAEILTKGVECARPADRIASTRLRARPARLPIRSCWARLSSGTSPRTRMHSHQTPYLSRLVDSL